MSAGICAVCFLFVNTICYIHSTSLCYFLLFYNSSIFLWWNLFGWEFISN